MLKNKTIVIVGLQSWDINIGSNCKNIALELSKNNRVFYINRPIDRKSYLKWNHTRAEQKRLLVKKSRKNRLNKVNKNLTVVDFPMVTESINWIGDNFFYNLLNKRNNKQLAFHIKSLLDENNVKEFILFNDSLMFDGLYLKELLNPSTYIYYIRDNLISQPYFKKHGEKIEPQLIQKADLVVTNSIFLANYAKKYNPNSHYVGQGCDLSEFSPNKKYSNPIESINGPIVGYVGYLTSLRLDIDLIYSIAKKMTGWSFVLVGPEDEEFKNSKLHELDNVHFIGAQPVFLLPSYIAHFDVCINPQLVNPMTIGNYPRKIDEYLAMGKPVVATKTEAMVYFEKHVSLCSSSEEYIKSILFEYNHNSKEKEIQRIEFANQHTWENNVKAICNSFEKIQKYA